MIGIHPHEIGTVLLFYRKYPYVTLGMFKIISRAEKAGDAPKIRCYFCAFCASESKDGIFFGVVFFFLYLDVRYGQEPVPAHPYHSKQGGT